MLVLVLCFVGKLCIVVISMLPRSVSDFSVMCANVLDVCSATLLLLTSAVAIVAVGADGALRYPPSYSIDEYILCCAPRLNARRFPMMPVSQALTKRMGDEECQKTHAGLQ